MNNEMILNRFALFASLSLEQAGRWEGFCTAARAELLCMLADGVDINCPENSARLADAAAGMALYRYSLVCSAQDVHLIKLGELQLTPNSSATPDALRLKEELLFAVRDLLAPRWAVIMRVNER